MELRAVWHVLPKWDEEADPEKAEWRINLKNQLDDLTKREESGTATDHMKRNEAYEVSTA